MKYANYDEKTNEILGFYDDNIHETIPTPNVKISDDEWQEALRIGANYIEKGKPAKQEIEIDEHAKQLAQLEADIKECEDDIKHALIIGNTAVLETLRTEYKELIAERERLNTKTEPTTVAPTDHL
ncbi:hypothetical protein [Campylobacter concisus]|uniref:hypothetical protein n=1 Tax=Campylobacter concisus TaxID=199 RepID=UPI000CD9CFFE|nr:hypothetical protein [Campylobacter concisus]